MEIVVIDGYVDEPAALGVRPFLHPTVRAMYGSALDAGARVRYLTVDHLRRGALIPRADLYAVYAGSSVPGRYLRSMPASARELRELLARLSSPVLLGGPATQWSPPEGIIMAKKDPAARLHDIIVGEEGGDRWRTAPEWNRWLMLGAEVATLHPDFPNPLVVEVETYRGCHRHRGGGCSFCLEPLKGPPLHRDEVDIIREVSRMREMGVVNFRLGGQTCFVSYKAVVSRDEVVPNPEAVERLLSGISALSPRVLHLDNANPSVIAKHPQEAEEVLRSVVRHCTSGNVLALGMESADPEVIRANNLNATPDQVMAAVALINDVGGERGDNGLQKLLPGLNIIIGLDGESERTLRLNLDFLRGVMESGNLLRRINIRQVMPVRRQFKPGVGRSDFIRFKETVRAEVDRPMLVKLVPTGTVLRGVYLELREGNRTFGRQVGTYPILVGFEYPLPTERFVDASVVGWGYRSVTAVEYPLPVNSCPLSALSSLPGIGKKRAMRLARARPLSGIEDLGRALGDHAIASEIGGMLGFGLHGEG